RLLLLVNRTILLTPTNHERWTQADQRHRLTLTKHPRDMPRSCSLRSSAAGYREIRVRTIVGMVHGIIVASLPAGVAESVDAPDSKSGEGNLVWVRVPPPALVKSPAKRQLFIRAEESLRTQCRGLWQQYGSSRLRKGFFHSGCGLVSHVGQHVRIRVEGYGYRRVSEHFGDNLGVHILSQQ
ncbi:MAG: hypothetical protein QOI57_3266, partial [Rubrobacteraceae bacterium]|nr:hypothetical protein [Rubrobacteraceae bacterium]